MHGANDQSSDTSEVLRITSLIKFYFKLFYYYQNIYFFDHLVPFFKFQTTFEIRPLKKHGYLNHRNFKLKITKPNKKVCSQINF